MGERPTGRGTARARCILEICAGAILRALLCPPEKNLQSSAALLEISAA
jgi:hypothetical protein